LRHSVVQSSGSIPYVRLMSSQIPLSSVCGLSVTLLRPTYRGLNFSAIIYSPYATIEHWRILYLL